MPVIELAWPFAVDLLLSCRSMPGQLDARHTNHPQDRAKWATSGKSCRQGSNNVHHGGVRATYSDHTSNHVRFEAKGFQLQLFVDHRRTHAATARINT